MHLLLRLWIIIRWLSHSHCTGSVQVSYHEKLVNRENHEFNLKLQVFAMIQLKVKYAKIKNRL